jgi:hypothetical protein
MVIITVTIMVMITITVTVTVTFSHDQRILPLDCHSHGVIKLIAFELAGEDRERRENPVVSRLKIAVYALHNVVERDFPLASRILRPTQTQSAL